MRIRQLHSWDLSVEEAIATQRELAKHIRQRSAFRGRVRRIAAADVSYDRGSDRIWAAVVVFSFPGLEPCEAAVHTTRVQFPYIPGLLSFREAPPVLDCLMKLEKRVDLLLLDAQGLAHPRFFGLACHIGLLSGLPAIGCAKSRLVGEHGPVGLRKGSRAPLYYNRRKIGVALRTRSGIQPVYISTGYRIGLARAISVVLACTGSFRVPLPLRAAHILANRARTERSLKVIPLEELGLRGL